MKRKSLIFALTTMFVMASLLVKAQLPNQQKFFATVGTGLQFSADMKSTTQKSVPFELTVGVLPVKYFGVGITMKYPESYTPGMTDSVKVFHPADSTKGTGSWTDYKKVYHKASTLLLTVEVMGGKKLAGGISTGGGLAFYENQNKLHVFPVWDLTLKGGYNFTPKIGAFLFSSYSYAWSKGNGCPSDGFRVKVGLECKIKF